VPDISPRNCASRPAICSREQRDDVAVPQDAELDILAVDLGAVRAFQVGQHDLVLVFLNLDVKPAHALVVQLQRVALLAANRHRRLQLVEDAAAIGPIEHA
jgi:hypothetical protein